MIANVTESRAKKKRKPDEDRPLVLAAQQGDLDALGELFMKHSTMVRRLLGSLVGSDSELDDLVQEVFLQVHRSIGKFRGDSRFTTWLHQLTVYAAYNHLRKPRGRYVPVDPVVLGGCEDEKSVSALDSYVHSETLERLDKALDKIKPKKRIAFTLFAIQGYSANEISEMVGASVPTVKSRIWFARREILKKARQDPYLSSWLSELDKNESST